MANTSQFDLPLLAASQAQKHVTVNEALAVFDCAAQLRLKSASIGTPPANNLDGDAYFLPTGSTDAWTGRDGELAVFSNGGWRFLAPRLGWRAFNEETSENQIFDGVGWVNGAATVTQSGAATLSQIIEVDHVVSAGGSSTATGLIPAKSVVLGVTARVISDLTGSLASWELGVSGSSNRYGSGYGLGLNSFAHGLTNEPMAYFADTDLVLTATGGSFAGGTVRLAVHCQSLVPPRSV